MSYFAQGLAYNLTVLKNAPTAGLAFLGVSKKQRQRLLSKKYIVREDASIDTTDGANAYYSYKHRQTLSRQNILSSRIIRDEFVHQPLFQSGFHGGIILSAHELVHAKNISENMRKMGRVDFPEQDHQDVIAACRTDDPDVKAAQRDAITYEEEIKAFRYQALIAAMISLPIAPEVAASLVKKARFILRAEMELQQLMTEQAIVSDEECDSDYPDEMMQRLWVLQARHDYAISGEDIFGKDFAEKMLLMTQDNIAKKRFDIRIVA